MEIVGKIILALPEVTGTSKAGNTWKKREYVLETQETYPRKVHFDFFGERADQYPLKPGDVVKLSFDIDSREYQGRWYTSIRGWKAEPATAASAPAAPAAAGQAFPEPPAAPAAPAAPFAGGNIGAAQGDDLPF